MAQLDHATCDALQQYRVTSGGALGANYCHRRVWQAHGVTPQEGRLSAQHASFNQTLYIRATGTTR